MEIFETSRAENVKEEQQMTCKIRKWALTDAKALAAALSNPNVQRNLRDGLPYPYTEQDGADFISAMLAEDENETFSFAITADDQAIGSIGVFRQGNIHRQTAELGYYIAEPYWGKGMMTEAVTQICGYVFSHSDILRIYAEPFAENKASCRVLEKSGFQYEGTLRANAVKNGRILDMRMYSLLKTDWTRQLQITRAALADLPEILPIYAKARSFMKETGNAEQWKAHYPSEEVLKADIETGCLYVVRSQGMLCAAFAFIIGAESTYAEITQGQWLSDTEYGTLHRIASNGTAHGIFDGIVTFCARKMPHLRIDTHSDNKVMQHLIRKNGFRECGIIHVADGSPRIAFERLPRFSS